VRRPSQKSIRVSAGLVALLGCAQADVLPDDRADILYHRYSGGGITVAGPSVLVRKKFGDHVSLAYNYYVDHITGHVDTISGASTDAVSGASTYHEERVQHSLSVDVLHDKTTYSAGFINSAEPDYHAKTAFGSVSESMFGDLTTVSFGFSRGWDRVGARGTALNAAADRRNFSVGVSQILTRNALVALNFETSESEGYLNNPYRLVRYVDPLNPPRGYSTQQEQYPHTRTGNAGAIQGKYFLPWHAALAGSYRFYGDTWGIRGHTGEIGYTQPVFRGWTLDGHVRLYKQTPANFYSDLFPYASSQNFMARDRELAAFRSTTLGVGATWEYQPTRFSWLRWVQKGTVNARLDKMKIKYSDYRDLSVIGVTPGTEPLYTLDASVFQFFISFWF